MTSLTYKGGGRAALWLSLREPLHCGGRILHLESEGGGWSLGWGPNAI